MKSSIPYSAFRNKPYGKSIVFSDIDAFAHRPGSTPGRADSNVFSLLSNEGGFLDGDIIALAFGGGATLLVSELDIATAMGAAGANIDVDALAYDDQGRILFSLSDPVGSVQDGDILRIWAGEKGSPACYAGTFDEADHSVSGSWVYPGGGGYESTMTRIND